ncbi:MAG: adenosine deaminase [Elusimicrobia bacterium]|nr:adenosine deaminase [Elusimicrobiota bacterium]
MELRQAVRAMPKAELHRHVEGCVSVPAIIRIGRRHGLALPTFDPGELEPMVKLKAPMACLDDVLRMFRIAQSVFVSLAALEEVLLEMLEHARVEENVALLEARFSPDFMLGGKGLDWQEALELAARTLSAHERRHGMVCGLILIASRSYGLASAEKTVDFAVRNRALVAGFDFADSEAAYPAALYRGLASRLRDAGIPLTVHSGEEGDWRMVEATLSELAPRRIGHGVRIADEPSGRLLERVKAEGVTIESNPWSNYLTHAVPSISAHPLPRFLRAGASVCIGADDPEILDTDLNKECLLAVERMGLTLADLAAINRMAVEGSFLSPDRKAEALRKMAAAGGAGPSRLDLGQPPAG